MAEINLGNIKFNWRGAYAGGTAYVVDDVVSSAGSSYVCILASTGNTPPNGTYWNLMAEAGTDGTNGTDVLTTLTTTGDMLYRDGSGAQRLGIGTAAQELRVNSGATAPEWYTPVAASSGLVQTVSATSNTNDSTSSTSFTATSLSLSITPSSASNKIILLSHFNLEPSSGSMYYNVNREIGGSNTLVVGDADGLGRQQDAGQQNSAAIAFSDTPNTTSQIIYTVYFKGTGSTVYFNGAASVVSLVAMEVSV